MTAKTGQYEIETIWRGRGEAFNANFSRALDLAAAEKATIQTSSDPLLRGDKTRWNPEELLLGALSSCHQLSYLAIAAAKGLDVVAYEDRASAEAVFAGPGRITKAVLRPRVTLAKGSDTELARALHKTAHKLCFIANSVNFEIGIEDSLIEAE